MARSGNGGRNMSSCWGRGVCDSRRSYLVACMSFARTSWQLTCDAGVWAGTGRGQEDGRRGDTLSHPCRHSAEMNVLDAGCHAQQTGARSLRAQGRLSRHPPGWELGFGASRQTSPAAPSSGEKQCRPRHARSLSAVLEGSCEDTDCVRHSREPPGRQDIACWRRPAPPQQEAAR